MISLIVLLPVAIAPKTGMDAYQTLATAVVGGLLIGTILSLFDIPIMQRTWTAQFKVGEPKKM